ncbi:hypothetical protein HO173_010346 [Letharia columbiana]|uniref:Uncharacterized protein n=1 Tax=Letharia columbiana TaxID=112416 RepID=A0A8H6FMQ3_9LECA|nr:uncharacterized protein HO173_010346 [Letharia columbiana]KAF6231386.1 hypothetical protein HO173_010346 [Letharia columbiana]
MMTSFPNNSSSLPPATTLHSQTPRQIFVSPFLGWYHAFTEPGLILVVPLAALSCIACIALSRLFTNILDNILTIWANSPPSNQVVLEAGNLRIEFGCTREPVPLDFIAEFVASHRDAVERSFAPVFTREWWWESGNRTRLCYAGLRIVEGGREAIPPSG